jgi:hypothetical protein
MFCVIPADAGIQALGICAVAAKIYKVRPCSETAAEAGIQNLNEKATFWAVFLKLLFADVQKPVLACIAFARDSP